MNGPPAHDAAPRPPPLPPPPPDRHDPRSLGVLVLLLAALVWISRDSDLGRWALVLVLTLLAVRALAFVLAARAAGVDPDARAEDHPAPPAER